MINIIDYLSLSGVGKTLTLGAYYSPLKSAGKRSDGISIVTWAGRNIGLACHMLRNPCSIERSSDSDKAGAGAEKAEQLGLL